MERFCFSRGPQGECERRLNVLQTLRIIAGGQSYQYAIGVGSFVRLVIITGTDIELKAWSQVEVIVASLSSILPDTVDFPVAVTVDVERLYLRSFGLPGCPPRQRSGYSRNV